MSDRTIPITLLPAVPIVPQRDFTKLRLTHEQNDNLWRIIGPTVQANLLRHGLGNLKEAFIACYWQGLENATSLLTKKEKPMSQTENQPMQFSNGLSGDQQNEIDDITIELGRLQARIEALGRHRSYSTAITKVDEARHWLQDRRHRAP